MRQNQRVRKQVRKLLWAAEKLKCCRHDRRVAPAVGVDGTGFLDICDVLLHLGPLPPPGVKEPCDGKAGLIILCRQGKQGRGVTRARRAATLQPLRLPQTAPSRVGTTQKEPTI